MPSPIVHAAAGYAVYRQHGKRQPEVQRKTERCLPFIVVMAALAPDLDFLAGVIHGQIRRFHNQGSHSIFTGIGFSFLVGLAGRLSGREFKVWMLPALAAFESHIILDFFSGGLRGMMLLWPFSRKRYKFPLKLFYGVKWDRRLVSLAHLWTIFTEFAFLLMGLLVVRALRKRNA